MFISRLEMSGFKSFASRTSVDFRNGVMAVVGPNGCGKSNIVDAVRWVLGEQRTSILRADRMDAVIFNGTARRKPVGLAEVILTIENDKGVLPTAYTQVELARRLNRAGDSEYLINRTSCRLRDIQDLFADTGFGHGAYSIIELPMVEGIISGPTEARRSLFEEAAGVAKFKSRRVAAERRLEQTRESLDRVNDVYGEVEKSFHTLKRQSGKARRFATLDRARQLRLLADLAGERILLVAQRGPAIARLKELERFILEADADIAKFQHELLKLEAEELNLESRSSRAQESLKRIERREAELVGELALVKQREGHLTGELADADRRRGELKEGIDSAREQREEAINEQTRLGEDDQGLKDGIRRIEAELKHQDEEARSAREHLADLRAREADLKRQLLQVSDNSRRIEAEKSRLAEAVARLKVRITEVSQSHSAALARQLGLSEKESTDSGRFDAIGTRLATVEAKMSALQGRSPEIAALFARTRASFESAKAGLDAHRSREAGSSIVPKSLRSKLLAGSLRSIAERINCPAEYRPAIAAGLKSALEAFDQNSLEVAIELAAGISTGETASMRVPGYTTPPVSDLALTPPEGVLAASSILDGGDEFSQFLLNRVSDLFIVADLDAIQSNADWARKHSVRLVTKRGDLFESDGILHAGTLDPESYRVGWQKRAEELSASVEASETAYRDAEKSHQQHQTALITAETELKSTRADYHRLEDDLARSRRDLAAVTEEIGRLTAREAELVVEAERTQGQLDSFAQASSSQIDSANLTEQLSALAIEAQEASTAVQYIEAARSKGTEERTRLLAESARVAERLSQAVQREKTAVQSGESRTGQLAALESKLASAGIDRSRSSQAAEGIEAQLGLIRREKTEVTTSFEEVKALKLESGKHKQATLHSLRDRQEAQKQATIERNKLEVDHAGFQERFRELDRRLLEDAGANPEQVDEKRAEQAREELQSIEMAELSLDQIKSRLQALGPVNMLALEELREVEERYRFLTDQKKDLEGGIELLTSTIDRINHEARRKFRETFDLVDQNFQNLFRTLFEGGEARITLEGGDPLEADIRIWATPTGKKLQGLSMLSGGEKTLTAISLLFAIYLVRPSPFCILDEVDAPLDDVNCARFNGMIKRFAKDTQFLIVTHNKRTMESADNLMGVTLAEDGASQLVSVSLE